MIRLFSYAKASLSAQRTSRKGSARETGLMRAFSVVHGYNAISIYGQVHVRGEELQCQCVAGNVVCCFHCAMWSHAIFRDT